MALLRLFRSRHAPAAVPPATPPPQDPQLIQNAMERLESLERAVDQLSTAMERRLDATVEVVQDLARDMDRFEKDLEEGLDVARRRENRIRAAVGRARKEFEDDGDIPPALAAEMADLRRGDAGGGGEQGVLPLRGAVEQDPLDRESSIPGVTLRDLWRANGMI